MKRRKKRKGTRITKMRRLIIIIILLVLVLAYVFLFSPIFKVRAVEVSGNKEITTEQIRESFSHKNIFLFSEEEIRNDLKNKFPKISKLEISKNLTKRSVSLLIKERERLSIICRMGLREEEPSLTEDAEGREKVKECFYIDKTGFVFDEAPETSGSLIILIKDYSQNSFAIGDYMFKEKITNLIFRIKENLFSETNIKPLDFNFTSFPYTDLKVITSEGWYILFNLIKSAEAQIEALKTAFSSGPDQLRELREDGELEYIDLRIENRIYYK